MAVPVSHFTLTVVLPEIAVAFGGKTTSGQISDVVQYYNLSAFDRLFPFEIVPDRFVCSVGHMDCATSAKRRLSTGSSLDLCSYPPRPAVSFCTINGRNASQPSWNLVVQHSKHIYAGRCRYDLFSIVWSVAVLILLFLSFVSCVSVPVDWNKHTMITFGGPVPQLARFGSCAFPTGQYLNLFGGANETHAVLPDSMVYVGAGRQLELVCLLACSVVCGYELTDTGIGTDAVFAGNSPPSWYSSPTKTGNFMVDGVLMGINRAWASAVTLFDGRIGLCVGGTGLDGNVVNTVSMSYGTLPFCNAQWVNNKRCR